MSRRSKTYCFCFGCCFFSSFAFGIRSSVRTNIHTSMRMWSFWEEKWWWMLHITVKRGKKCGKKLFFSDWFKINNAPCDLDVHLKEGFCFHFSRSMQLYHVHNTAKWNHMTKLSGTSMHRVKNSEYWWAFQLFYHFSQTHHILWSPIFHWNRRKKHILNWHRIGCMINWTIKTLWLYQTS